MKYLLALVVLAAGCSQSATEPSEKPSFVAAGQPVCGPGTHKKITLAVPGHPGALRWVCVPN